MPIFVVLLISVVSLLLGGGITYVMRSTAAKKRIKAAELRTEKLVAEAETRSKEMVIEAKEEAIKVKASHEEELKQRRQEIQRLERRLTQKEENLERKLDNLERRDNSLGVKEREVDSLKNQLEELKSKQKQQLQIISSMSSEEAKTLLLKEVESEIKDEVSRRVREMEIQLKESAEEKAREILPSVIQRCATDVVSETTVSVVPLPSDEMKGRLIGREGRNIRALEHATGVELIIDDTPEAVTLSCFDAVRREIARVALTKLIQDGRIHPARIEEIVEKARTEVEAVMKAAAEQAVYKVGIQGLHPEIMKLLGRLKYRTSYGQNVLNHSVETALLAGMLASEVSANPTLAKRAGLLHDLGKAVDHQVEGSHAQIGADLLKNWEKSPDIIQAVNEHHGETGNFSTLGFIVSTADAISGGRPGARGESLELYLKRLEALESVANSFPGVDKSFAIQAGREIRIMVKPEEIDDLGAMRLARDIVKKIQESMEYPGQIKVTVIREKRVVEYAK